MSKLVWSISLVVLLMGSASAATYSIVDTGYETDIAFWAAYRSLTNEQTMQQLCGEGIERAARLRSQIEGDQALAAFQSASPETQAEVRTLLGLPGPP